MQGREENKRIIVDACAIGMGQGAGNLQTELIAFHLMKEYSAKYDFMSVLDVCEIVEKHLQDNLWGYSVTRMLPALHKIAYKYAVSFRNHYHLSFREMHRIFAAMPEEYRNRYTPESADEVLKKSML